jgi:hypothetical protein
MPLAIAARRSEGGRPVFPSGPLRGHPAHGWRPQAALSVEKITRAIGEVGWMVRWRQHGRHRADRSAPAVTRATSMPKSAVSASEAGRAITQPPEPGDR